MSASQPIALNSLAPEDRRLAANRANALLSTGPRTPQGKAKSSLNAVKTGLTGRTVLLPSDDAAVYQVHVKRCLQSCAPDLFADEPNTQVRAVLLEAHVYESAAKSLETLQRQEQRLRRQYSQEIK